MSRREENLNHSDQKGLYRTLAVVALPIALQSLIGSSLNLVDNLMVGSLGKRNSTQLEFPCRFILFIGW